MIGVYGASGFGREVLPLVRRTIPSGIGAPDDMVFVNDAPAADVLNGYRVLAFDALLAESSGQPGVILAVADSRLRERLDQKCRAAGANILPVQASNAEILDDVTIGEGSVICPFVTFNSNIRIGRCFQASLDYGYAVAVLTNCRGDGTCFAAR